VAHGDGDGDVAIALQDGAAQGHGLGADCQPPHRRAEVHAGPDPSVAAAQRRCHGMPERPVVPQHDGPRRRDQLLVRRRQRQARQCGMIGHDISMSKRARTLA